LNIKVIVSFLVASHDSEHSNWSGSSNGLIAGGDARGSFQLDSVAAALNLKNKEVSGAGRDNVLHCQKISDLLAIDGHHNVAGREACGGGSAIGDNPINLDPTYWLPLSTTPAVARDHARGSKNNRAFHSISNFNTRGFSKGDRNRLAVISLINVSSSVISLEVTRLSKAAARLRRSSSASFNC